MNYSNDSLPRRQFLKSSLLSAAGLTTAGTVGINLSLANYAMAQSSSRFEDYKALVCVFLYGGNDSFNMLVPTDELDYQLYQSVRQNLAYSQQNLLPISPVNEQPYALGMPDAMQEIQTLFAQNKLSLIANTGPLIQPVNKLDIFQNESLLPGQLFSHNDQQNLWQMGMPKSPKLTGWAGRMADLIMDSDVNLPLNLSLDGTNLFQTGNNSLPFSLNSSGPESFEGLDPQYAWNLARSQTFEELIRQSTNILERQYTNVYRSAAINNNLVAEALEGVEDKQDDYPAGNSLAEQLKMVARLISVQQVLQHPRQIFYVGLGGWDTHDAQAALHPQLLTRLGQALAAFNADIESQGLSNSVTTFTLSDFGRTLTSNGDGTDHGWGGHQLVMGGAVKGGDIYGHLPSLQLNSDDDIGGGRMIPGSSVEQYGATLAKWFGLSDQELTAVFPNLGNFPTGDLGFLNT